MNGTPKEQFEQRPRVLVVSRPDGSLEAYGTDEIAVKIVRVPASFSRDAEEIGERYFEQALPKFWSDVYWPGNIKAAGTSKPLLPSTIARAQQTKQLLRELNDLPAKLRTTDSLPNRNNNAAAERLALAGRAAG